MGMLYEIIRIPDEVRKELLREPYGIYKLLDIEPQPEMPPLPQKKNFLRKLKTLFTKQAETPPGQQKPEKEFSELIRNVTIAPADALQLDKTWHILHYLMGNGDEYQDLAFPRGFLLFPEAESVGDIDIGYGPAELYSPDQVRRIADFTDSLDPAEMKRRLNPAELSEAEIYPAIWNSSDLDLESMWNDIYENYFLPMKAFLHETAERDLAILEIIE